MPGAVNLSVPQLILSVPKNPFADLTGANPTRSLASPSLRLPGVAAEIRLKMTLVRLRVLTAIDTLQSWGDEAVRPGDAATLYGGWR